MKNNTPPTSESVTPMSFKLTLMGGAILVMVMLILTVRSIIGVLRHSSSPPAAMQTNTETVGVQSETPAVTPPLPVLDNSQTASSSSNQPLWLTDPNKFVEQCRPARIAALEEIQRQRKVPVPYEIKEQREKQRKALIEAAKKELIEQAGTSGVPKEVLQKLENSNPIPF